MKHTMKKLSLPLLTCVSFLLLSNTSAHADSETLTASGVVASPTCALTITPAGSATAVTTVTMPDLTQADYTTKTVAGIVGSSQAFTIKAVNATTGGTCAPVSKDPTTGLAKTYTTFTTLFSGTSNSTDPTKVALTNDSVATNVTFDLTTSVKSVDLTKSVPLDQHGLSPIAFATGMTFTANWYRTGATNPTSGLAKVQYTISSFYN